MQYPVIDTDIPYAPYPPTFEDLQARVNAAFNSLAEICDDVEVSDTDIAEARAVFTGTKPPTETLLSSPGTIVHLKAVLDEYDKVVIQSAAQLRTYVTNKLILDSTNPDPRIRIKCYELLGKISDVGLFTDKTEVTMRHRPTEELEQLLRERLMKTLEADQNDLLTPPADITDI
jgi:hypothetical protein